MKEVKAPSQVAEELDVSTSTLRKYSLLLEENGIEFKRNAKNSRQYTDKDVITLQKFITLVKTDGMTVEDAAFAVSGSIFNKKRTDESSVIESDMERYNDDMAAVIVSEVKALKEVIKEQQEIIDGFRVSQEKRDSYFVEILEELQNEIKELQKQNELPAPEEQEEIEEEPEKRSFFSRFFKK